MSEKFDKDKRPEGSGMRFRIEGEEDREIDDSEIAEHLNTGQNQEVDENLEEFLKNLKKAFEPEGVNFKILHEPSKQEESVTEEVDYVRTISSLEELEKALRSELCEEKKNNLGKMHLKGFTVKPEDGKRFRPFINLNLEQAFLEDIIFVDCNFIRPNFKNAKLKGVSFVNCKLESGSMENAKLINVRFKQTILNRPPFNKTNLTDANLLRCKFIEVNLQPCISLIKIKSAENTAFNNCLFLPNHEDTLISKGARTTG